jgi:hypothetical protein
VNRFPVDLGKGTKEEGVPTSEKAPGNVLVGLGLTKKAKLPIKVPDPQASLLNEPYEISHMIVGLTKPSLHCILIAAVFTGGLHVMDPEYHDFRPMTWAEFLVREPCFFLL